MSFTRPSSSVHSQSRNEGLRFPPSLVVIECRMVTLQDAVDDFYRISEKTKQSTKRLSVLAQLVAEELEKRGLRGTQSEVRLRAFSRAKDWDAVYVVDNRVRVAVSCKSILANLSGTVPNRVDDMMGEAADLQLRYPEVVIGYIMILNEADPRTTRENATRWIGVYERRLASLTIRTPPLWQGGLIEAGQAVRVDFERGPKLVSPPDVLDRFFDKLVEEHQIRTQSSFVERNPLGKRLKKPPALSSNPTLNPAEVPSEGHDDD